MVNNADVEMRWVAAWEEVHRLAGKERGTQCLLPEGAIVDVETCLGWIQDEVYAGFLITVEPTWISGRRAIFVSKAPAPDWPPVSRRRRR